jgi:hypothetical protein
MKRIIIFGLLSVCFSFSDAQNADPRKAYEEFKKKAIGDYDDFRQQANRKYADFLAEAWKSFRTMPAISKPKEKPVPPVKYDNNQVKPLKNRPLPYDTVIAPAVIPEQPKPVAPVPEVVQPDESKKSFTFYGISCSVSYPSDNNFILSDVAQKSLSKAWKNLSDSKFNNLINDCLKARKDMNLCDWAYLQFLDKVAKACTGNDNNAAVLLKDFLFCQSGYETRLGVCDGHLVMLVATSRGVDIYDHKYFDIDGIHFYPLDCKADNMDICVAEFPGEKGLSLIVGDEQHFASEITQKRHLSSQRYQNVSAQVQTNKELIDFYNTYPQSQKGGDFGTRWQYYANTPLSETAQEGLYPALRLAITGLNQSDEANIILNFVQTSLVSKYDEEVWGYDRPFFPDETLYYPYCDCEDRAILFSRIVRDIMHLDVILIYYPNHLASAVNFTEEVNGDYLLVNGKKYVVCDPTFIGAPVGRTMTGMDNATAKAILLDF